MKEFIKSFRTGNETEYFEQSKTLIIIEAIAAAAVLLSPIIAGIIERAMF